MRLFIFRCPNTRLNVQGALELEEEPGGEGKNSYRAVQCMACGQMHFVDPETGKLMSESDDQ